MLEDMIDMGQRFVIESLEKLALEKQTLSFLSTWTDQLFKSEHVLPELSITDHVYSTGAALAKKILDAVTLSIHILQDGPDRKRHLFL